MTKGKIRKPYCYTPRFKVSTIRAENIVTLYRIAKEVETLRDTFCTDILNDKDTRKLNDEIRKFRQSMDMVVKVHRVDISTEMKSIHKQYSALIDFLVKKCGSRKPSISFPSFSVDVDINTHTHYKCNGQDMPDTMRAWYELENDPKWKDKNVFCRMVHNGKVMQFEQGQLLNDGFEVVMIAGAGAGAGAGYANIDIASGLELGVAPAAGDGPWVAIARRKRDDEGGDGSWWDSLKDMIQQAVTQAFGAVGWISSWAATALRMLVKSLIFTLQRGVSYMLRGKAWRTLVVLGTIVTLYMAFYGSSNPVVKLFSQDVTEYLRSLYWTALRVVKVEAAVIKEFVYVAIKDTHHLASVARQNLIDMLVTVQEAAILALKYGLSVYEKISSVLPAPTEGPLMIAPPPSVKVLGLPANIESLLYSSPKALALPAPLERLMIDAPAERLMIGAPAPLVPGLPARVGEELSTLIGISSAYFDTAFEHVVEYWNNPVAVGLVGNALKTIAELPVFQNEVANRAVNQNLINTAIDGVGWLEQFADARLINNAWGLIPGRLLRNRIVRNRGV